MDSELYDKVARLMLQGWDVDDAVQQGLFERSEVDEVYRLLERQPWGIWRDEREQRANRHKTN